MRNFLIDKKRENNAFRKGFRDGIKKNGVFITINIKYQHFYYLGYNNGLAYKKNRNKKGEVLNNNPDVEKIKRDRAKQIGNYDGFTDTDNISQVKPKFLYYYQDGFIEGEKRKNKVLENGM